MSEKTVIVTGGAGFIGVSFVRLLLAQGCRVVNLDLLTYAGNLGSLADVASSPRYEFVKGDIRDAGLVGRVMADYRPDAVVNLAAESHVDRSIDSPGAFVQTNVVGTFVLLSEALRHLETLPPSFKFIHVSTDEVFGSLAPGDAPVTELSPYAPNSPYSASKAGADHLARAWHATYGFPSIVTHCSNNYGPYQFPEKLIPRAILSALKGDPVPVYGDGRNIRDWIHVSDHCLALLSVLEDGTPGETYNISGENQRENIEVVRLICAALDELRPRPDGRSYLEQIGFVQDRPGHDRRYAVDASKIRRGLGWSPKWTFEDGIRHTVSWYLEHQAWVEAIRSYRLERLGVGGTR
ncbi:MAG: dTDP-glucose 4,6-dehydratase [Synergistaceae bacterium]|jgi:dTDP-glucose 4,6-dehydratase|nr:dTDP-glucose 4,6-dehydratase [Synergistaceae bacterium]